MENKIVSCIGFAIVGLLLGLKLGSSQATSNGSVLSMLLSYLFTKKPKRNRLEQLQAERQNRPLPKFIHRHISSLIGNTPMLELTSLSQLTGCRIIGKCEFLNPGGSAKDRLALQLLTDAVARGDLKLDADTPATVCEGTVGSTGISLTMLCQSLGLRSHITMPNDTSREKSDLLSAMGATVQRVPPASIVDPEMYVNVARKTAESIENGYFADQFETESNFWVHYNETGPEIWNQMDGKLDAVVLGAGTGGTISGVSTYLKEQNSKIKVVLADPQGSSLFNLVQHKVCHAKEQDEGTRRRHQSDTLVEGIGLQRVTKSFAMGLDQIDSSIRVSDQSAVNMSRYLLAREGLFLGTSSAVHCCAALRLALQLGPGHTIVTFLSDPGYRYLARFWSKDYLAGQGSFKLFESVDEMTISDLIE